MPHPRRRVTSASATRGAPIRMSCPRRRRAQPLAWHRLIGFSGVWESAERCSKPGRGRRRMRNRAVGVFVMLSLAAVLSGATGVAGARMAKGTQRGPAVTVASFDFAESRLLAEVYAQALERAGLPVRRAFDLGPRGLVLPALEQHLVDVVPEYVGSALQALSPGAAVPSTGPEAALALSAAA